MVSDQIVGTAPLAPLAPLAPMRSHRAPPLRLTNKPVSPPARTVCASVGWATNACIRLLSGNGARCRIHDFPASGLCHTPPQQMDLVLGPISHTGLVASKRE